MITHNLGYPRIGSQRELKKACEQYWQGKTPLFSLLQTAKNLRRQHWQLQKDAGIELIPSNDFSLYDQVLDTALMTGAIPQRYHKLMEEKQLPEADLLFAMARGYQKDGYDITAMEMTKWFDTNYHYIVPEFTEEQSFLLFSEKVVKEFNEAKREGFNTKPVLLGPVSFLLLGKEKLAPGAETGFNRLHLLKKILPVYMKVLKMLDENNAHYIQFDEPCLCLNLTAEEQEAVTYTYTKIQKAFPGLHIILAAYFECYGQNLQTVLSLPVQTLHLDLMRCPSQLDDLLQANVAKSSINLSLGVVDGRNIWKNDFTASLQLIEKAVKAVGRHRVWIAPSCSLLHVPCDLTLETDENNLPGIIKNWMAFAKQKLEEVVILAKLAGKEPSEETLQQLAFNKQAVLSRSTSAVIHKQHIKTRVNNIKEQDTLRQNVFEIRKTKQQQVFALPLFPTTTIGSFPQTAEVRSWRAKWKKGQMTNEEYDTLIKAEIKKAIAWQEEAGIDVLVHGEFERNDMVEYFGEQLEGFVFTQNGWVQSYGSRCVKPPVIAGDVERKQPMTLYYTRYAQGLTSKPVKGMLTGPVTILQWSFVRNDQPRRETCMQIALAIRDEIADLEAAGIKIIQADEPAIREGLPLRQEGWEAYINWAVKAFKVATAGVADETQVHTHMCYAEFNDIMPAIAAMDADVITIETSRSQMELLEAFKAFKYPNDIGPGVYDIHSPRVPATHELTGLLFKALEVLPAEQLWINPDCGLKTRGWAETKAAVAAMIGAAKQLRAGAYTTADKI